jgi:hypothetical protein
MIYASWYCLSPKGLLLRPKTKLWHFIYSIRLCAVFACLSVRLHFCTSDSRTRSVHHLDYQQLSGVRALVAGGSLTAPPSSGESKPPTIGLNYFYILRKNLLILWMEITAVYCEWYITEFKALSTPSRRNITADGLCTRSYHCASQSHRIAFYPSVVRWMHRR